MPDEKPKKPTRQQREILLLLRDGSVRRWTREAWTRTGSTVTFYWAPDIHGRPGPELSERVITNMMTRGWVESRRPDRKPASLRDMMAWQAEGTLHLTDAGKATLAS